MRQLMRWTLPTVLWLVLALSGGAIARTKLLEFEMLPGGATVLQNGTGTIRLEDTRMGRVGSAVVVPEPGVFCQLGSGTAFLVLMAAHRGRTHRRRDRARWKVDP